MARCNCGAAHNGDASDIVHKSYCLLAPKPTEELMPGGANRESQPTDYSQLSYHALRLMAETQAEGNNRYGVGNWQKGLPISNLLSHALEHILKLQNGDISENHLGHALWNLEKAAHFIKERPDLIDVIPMRKAMGLDE